MRTTDFYGPIMQYVTDHLCSASIIDHKVEMLWQIYTNYSLERARSQLDLGIPGDHSNKNIQTHRSAKAINSHEYTRTHKCLC